MEGLSVRYAVNKMTMADLPRVLEIEKLAYPTSQWPASAYRRELQDNSWAHYIVARDISITPHTNSDGEGAMHRRGIFSLLNPARTIADPFQSQIIGYAGLWLMVDEAHVTTIATHPRARGQGVGELLLAHLIDIAYQIGARWVTLEVRVSNTVAQNLYHKYGFKIVSTRPRYYSDNNEDAYIMWTDEITAPDYRGYFADLKRRLYQRLEHAEERVTG
jgi:ribosomal-protein-alanine N-acetyltransferase